jgi:hypothetical protein
MIPTAIIALLAGAVLAQRFRIFILLPLLALAAFAAIIAAFATGTDAWHFVFVAIIAAVGLQIGYLAGAAYRVWELSHSKQADAPAAVEKPKPGAGALPVH